MNHKRRAVFIDRDGVVNPLIYRGDNHVVQGKICPWTAPYSCAEFEIFPFVSDALRVLGKAGFLRIVVTNQPDVSYGLLPEEDYVRMMAEVRRCAFEDVLVCLHMRDEGCECKKPKPGMLLSAAQKWGIDLARSYMVGDTERDEQAAEAAGCRFILVSAPYNINLKSALRVSNLLEAANLITHLERGELL